ncbi:hypothetical protein A3B60_01815 [Candidatus Peregrinibacteria bacterium RIFCSPLOWO2_01_FULL_39_12]|nr:MAG: hypothetical protein A3B60_01815 [Candidatus Peregrinibacteria bacterium RIFCSPLOWO2_01_FULL_39_12]OGJ43496.1 MAG: hypothetical protein A3I58_02530 [Candidatus Peregrinibacteria bacterium RIFCSPLOWO2_02_FULL_39_10]
MPSRQKYIVAGLHSLLFDGSQLPPPLSTLHSAFGGANKKMFALRTPIYRGSKNKNKINKNLASSFFNIRKSNKKTQKQMNGR